jgi:hypothetical protein
LEKAFIAAVPHSRVAAIQVACLGDPLNRNGPGWFRFVDAKFPPLIFDAGFSLFRSAIRRK